MDTIFLVGGTRPNFIKLAPITRSFKRFNLNYEIIHTGQHYDYEMDQIFFREFNLKQPFKHLNVGSDSHAKQTAKIMVGFEKVCIEHKPSLVFVVGDVNSTLACSLVAVKLGIEVAHQEAGCRSGNRKTPEEINRVVADGISDYLFTSTPDDKQNLLNEGIPSERIFLVGDVVIDNLMFYLKDIKSYNNSKYCLVTIHRDYNTDNEENLTQIVKSLQKISNEILVIFPIHPRTKKMIERFELGKYLEKVNVCNPFGYLDFIEMLRNASVLITDSGGLQVESTFLNIPCINVREKTSSKFTIEQGTNILVGKPNENEIFNKVINALKNPPKSNLSLEMKQLLDGNASDRISIILKRILS